MTDRHIDYFEVKEYGSHFVTEAAKLAGLSPLVDVDALRQKVQGAADAVSDELQKAGIQRSELRGGREATSQATAPLRGTIDRFYHHVLSLPVTTGVDVEAFFPGRTLGSVAKLKPADLAGKADQVLRGFAAPQNAGIPGLSAWREEIEAARGALEAGLQGKGSARGRAITGTAGLIAARARFITVYNGVAKPLLRGLLADLGRAEELRLFFLDLQVNEGGPARKSGEVEPLPPPALA